MEYSDRKKRRKRAAGYAALMLLIALAVFTPEGGLADNWNFSTAREGEVWRLVAPEHIGLMWNPEISANQRAFNANLITMLSAGTRVEIIRSRGVTTRWKEVYTLGVKTGKPKLRGWILVDSVDSADRVKLSRYSSD